MFPSWLWVPHEPVIVHRLDTEESSGAVLFTKIPFILPILNRLFEEWEDSAIQSWLEISKFLDQGGTVAERCDWMRPRHWKHIG